MEKIEKEQKWEKQSTLPISKKWIYENKEEEKNFEKDIVDKYIDQLKLFYRYIMENENNS